MNPNDRVRITAGLPDHIGKEGNVIQVVRYEDVEGLMASILEQGLEDEPDTAFVAVQLDDPGFEPVTDEELFIAELFQGIPTELTAIMRDHRTAVIFDDSQVELVNA